MELVSVIKGFGIRGYSHYKDNWDVQTIFAKKKLLQCKITKYKSGESIGVFCKDKKVGNMPTELTGHDGKIKLKEFLTQHSGQTEIEATVTDSKPSTGGKKGPEIPCEYVLKGEDITEIREALSTIEIEVNKIGRQIHGVSCSKVKPRGGRKKVGVSGDGGTNKPKRSLSAHNLFFRDKTVEIQADYPEMSSKERTNIIGGKWKDMTREQKQVYENKAENEKNERYKESMKLKIPNSVRSPRSATEKGKGHGKPKSTAKTSKSDSLLVPNSVKSPRSATEKGKGHGKHKSTTKASKSDGLLEIDGNLQVNGTSADDKRNNETEGTRVGRQRTSLKRRSDETDETIPKKVASDEQLQGRNGISNSGSEGCSHAVEEDDHDIVLSEAELNKIAKQIGYNWKLLGFELGLSHVKLQHIDMNHQTVEMRMHTMLMKWKEETHDEATLYQLKTAINNSSNVTFDHENLRNIFTRIKDQRKISKDSEKFTQN